VLCETDWWVKLLSDTTLLVHLPPGYPENEPPLPSLQGPSTRTTSIDMGQVLAPLWDPGCVCVYQWAEHLKELLEKDEPQFEVSEMLDKNEPQCEVSETLDKNEPQCEVSEEKDVANAKDVANSESTTNFKYSAPSRQALRAPRSIKRGQRDREFGAESLDPQHAVEIHHGEALLVKKSAFTAHLAEVSSSEQVQWVHRHLLEDKKIANSTHNILAYRYWNGKEVITEHDDDNEIGAGASLAVMLEQCGNQGVFIMVSRTFGGVVLHSERFRCIKRVALCLLESVGLLSGKATRRQKRKP